MPIERRDILFTHAELADILGQASGRYPSIIPGNIRTAPPVEAIQVSDGGHSIMHQNKRLAALLREPPRENGIVFRSLSNAGQEKAFFLTERILVDLLLGEMQKQKIILARAAEKKVLVDGIYVGLRMTLGKIVTLELED